MRITTDWLWWFAIIYFLSLSSDLLFLKKIYQRKRSHWPQADGIQEGGCGRVARPPVSSGYRQKESHHLFTACSLCCAWSMSKWCFLMYNVSCTYKGYSLWTDFEKFSDMWYHILSRKKKMGSIDKQVSLVTSGDYSGEKRH